MAADSYGPRGEPQFAGSGASADAEDLTLLGSHIALSGNHKVGTTDQRNAASIAADPVQVWEGLLWTDTTDRVVYQYLSGGWQARLNDTGWQPFNIASISGYTEVSNSPVAYRRVNNVIHFRGRLSRTGGSDNFFQLPNGYRPVNAVNIWPVIGSGNTIRSLQIASNGVMTFIDGGTFTAVSLQGVSFVLG